MFILILCSYDNNKYAEGFLPINLCLFTLGTLFAVWTILPATSSNGKQNIQFQQKID